MPDTVNKLVFDAEGQRFYETGVKECALFPMADTESTFTDGTLTVKTRYTKGVAWNGITAITEQPSGAEPTALYADDIKYLNLMSNEDFGATVEAYTYPDEFKECDGSKELCEGVIAGQQTRKAFGLAYKTVLGNDTEGNAKGFKLHIIYNAKASPSEKAYSTINDSPEATTFSWEMTTTPVSMPAGFKPTACLTIDSTKVESTKLEKLLDIIYGKDGDAGIVPHLPMPSDIMSILSST